MDTKKIDPGAMLDFVEKSLFSKATFNAEQIDWMTKHFLKSLCSVNTKTILIVLLFIYAVSTDF